MKKGRAVARRFWRVIFPMESPTELKTGARTRDGTYSPTKNTDGITDGFEMPDPYR